MLEAGMNFIAPTTEPPLTQTDVSLSSAVGVRTVSGMGVCTRLQYCIIYPRGVCAGSRHKLRNNNHWKVIDADCYLAVVCDGCTDGEMCGVVVPLY